VGTSLVQHSCFLGRRGGKQQQQQQQQAQGAAAASGLTLSCQESSRKFVTNVRKYLRLYLHLCAATGDSAVLEAALHFVKSDKRVRTLNPALDPVSEI